MAARLFLVKWAYSNDEFTNPLLDYLSNHSVGDIIQWWYHADQTGVNTRYNPWVFCLVFSPTLPGSTIEQLGNISGVTLVPAMQPSKLLSSIPAAKRNQIQTFLTNNGFNISSLNASSTVGDLYDCIVGTLTPLNSWKQFKNYTLSNDADFEL